MAKTVTLHQIDDLSGEQCNNEILLQTNINTELHIIAQEEQTIITFPFGNKFDIKDGYIIVHSK